MTSCERLSDRMPAVARGEAAWSAEESRHLAGCAECAAEWQVISAAARLGRELPPMAPPAVTAERVLARIRRERRQGAGRRVAWTGAALAAAAAAVLFLWSDAGIEQRTQQREAVAAARLEVPVPELEPLDAEELQAVLEAMDEPASGDSAPDTPALGDLDHDELEQLLRTWEG